MDTERARELLATERERIERALAHLAQAIATPAPDAYDTADLASSLYARELDEALADELRQQLAAVTRAEQRLLDGTYGLSLESGRRIPDERLEVLPAAELTAEEEAGRRSAVVPRLGAADEHAALVDLEAARAREAFP